MEYDDPRVLLIFHTRTPIRKSRIEDWEAEKYKIEEEKKKREGNFKQLEQVNRKDTWDD